MRPYCPAGTDDDMIAKLVIKHNGNKERIANDISEWHQG
jgi:hypothetical protein